MSPNDLLQLSHRLLVAAWHSVSKYAGDHPWAVAVLLYGLARAFGVMIQSGQRGVLFRWGRAAMELEPGFHWLVPLVHGVRTTPVRSVTIDLPDQKVMTADGLVYHVGVNLVYRVENATRALTLIDHIDAGCRAAIPIIVTQVVCARSQAQLVDRVSLDRELSERTHAWIAQRWGLVWSSKPDSRRSRPDKSVLRTTQAPSKNRGTLPGLAHIDRRRSRRRIRADHDRHGTPAGGEVEPALPPSDAKARPDVPVGPTVIDTPARMKPGARLCRFCRDFPATCELGPAYTQFPARKTVQDHLGQSWSL